jgi:hypothetical protein
MCIFILFNIFILSVYNILGNVFTDIPVKYCSLTGAFFNYITGGAKAPPAPMVAPPLNYFGPPSQSLFSLKYKQNMEFRREV